MHVTRHSQVNDPRLIESLWTLYVRAYLPTARDTVTHEMLDKVEFTEHPMRCSTKSNSPSN